MCTSINVIAKDGYHVLGRTMDWDDLLVSPIFTPVTTSGPRSLTTGSTKTPTPSLVVARLPGGEPTFPTGSMSLA